MKTGLVRLAVGAALCCGLPAAPRATRTAASSALLRSLSLHDRIAQLIVVRGYGDYPPTTNDEYRRFERWITRTHVGGFIVAGRIRNGNVIPAQPFEMATFINRMQHLTKTPLLVGSDFERGASMRVASTARFPYMMAFGAARDLAAVRELGAATAQEARALGVNWVFAPDADVNNNPDNPIINTRSFGEDPQSVATAVGTFIEGAHADPGNYVLLSAKHFPGHGDTADDSHLQLARLSQSKERIESLELVPFRAAIAHDVDSIMTAHLAVPAFEPEEKPATVSHAILTDLLRNELGFRGLVVTDAMEMQGVMSLYSAGEAAVRAIEAGADVLLMPTDPDECVRAIMSAVAHKRLSLARINLSAAKVLAAKQRVGLFRSRLVDLNHLTDELAAERFDMLAQRVSDEAFTLTKDSGQLFPMTTGDGSCLVVLNESAFSTRGQMLAQTLKSGGAHLAIYVTDASMPDSLLADFARDLAHCKQIYAATFVTVSASRGSVALEGGLGGFLKSLANGQVPVAVISFGSPYLWRDVPNVAAYAATFSTTTGAEVSAGRALLGQIPIRGRLPVSIPPLAKAGDGLDVAARTKAASNGTK